MVMSLISELGRLYSDGLWRLFVVGLTMRKGNRVRVGEIEEGLLIGVDERENLAGKVWLVGVSIFG